MKNPELSVLIVDDNSGYVQSLIRSIVPIDRLRIAHVVDSYEEAIWLLREVKHDLVIMDSNLSGTKGAQLLNLIENAPWGCDVVMLANYSGNAYKAACSRLKEKYFIDDTIEVEMVPDMISELQLN